jgi:hypothetical protein
MDRTEKMLLRATKALFAYKVAQIRAYESLSKVEDFFRETGEVNLNLFVDLLDQAKYLTATEDEVGDVNNLGDVANLLIETVGNALSEVAYDAIKNDVLKLLEREAFSGDNSLTTWIVDPNSTDNYSTGPGTGVIELGTFVSFNTNAGLSSDPQQASIELVDPYRIMNITEDDIEIALEEALNGTIGLLSELASGNPDLPPVDGRSIVSAGIELLGPNALAEKPFGDVIPNLLAEFDNTINVDYIRDRLRVFYLGKSIINPADGVHFYIRSNKGLIDYSLEESPVDSDFFEIDETILEAERQLFTNKQIDFKTFKKIRQFSDNSFAFRHVFGGYVTRTSESFGGGQWTLKVDCIDNMGWLTWSQFMIEPALQDPQGVLEDPLTPFELKTDSTGRILSAGGPELLDENKELLRSGLISYDSGILNGQVATESNLLQGQYNQSGSLSKAKVFQHPQGFIYRWKTGILTATVPVNTVDPLDEADVTQKTHNQVYGLTVAEDVLNNLDIANILSLLIVGQPYNVETFMDQAYKVHNITRTSSSTLSQTDPLSAVLDVVRRQNNRFGDFRPYRMITMSNSTVEQSASANFMRNEINVKLKQLRNRRVQIDSLLKKLGAASGDNGVLVRSLLEERDAIEAGISDQIDILGDSGNISSVDLLTSNFNLFGNNRTLPLTGNFSADHELTRAMTIVGAQRRIEDVRLNRDNNLFIVSDQYDENTDIRPFLFQIRNSDYKVFRGDFANVHDKCSIASKFMNMEFFCNTQGHLEFRPPQWNRTPLTILRRLFEINEESGKKIIPDFLTETFEMRTSSLRREIHTLNIRIVLLALLLGKYPDGTLIPNMPTSSASMNIPEGSRSGKASLRFFGVREKGLKTTGEKALELKTDRVQTQIGDLVNTGDQLLGSGIRLEAGLGDEGDILNGDTETLLGFFDPIFQEQNNITQNVLNVASNPGGESSIKIATASNLNKIRNEFKKSFGKDPGRDLATESGQFQTSDFIFSANASDPNAVGNNIAKANNYLNKLQETISNRDRLVTILQRNIEKQEELDQVESILSGEFTAPDEPTGGPLGGVVDWLDRANNTVKTVQDIFSGEASQGSLFDHLVEDDTRNLLGPGSGRRYIIEEHDIISCTYVEEPPEFTRVDVVGDAPVIGEQQARTFEDRYYWAGGSDFDLWRQFGYKQKEVNLPFANNPELHCRPFAIFELQLQRVKVNQANITVVGNEYYEPGDVVYIRDKGLLYYVRSVSHSFSIGNSFTTSLVLENGHPPGVYLPSPLDIIGQQLAGDPLEGNVLVYRNSKGDDDYRELQPDSSIIFPPNVTVTENDIAFLLDHKDNAIRFVNMMTDLNTLMLGNRVVLIRGFVRGKDDPETADVRQRLRVIRSMLQNPSMLVQSVQNVSEGGFLADAGTTALSGFGVTTGNKKGTQPMVLPNGIRANPIPSENIVEQIVVLNKETDKSNIQCLNPSLLQAQILDDTPIGVEDVDSVFPKGGPKQRTWLDFRDNLTQVSRIVEIGVLDIQRALNTADSTKLNTDGLMEDIGAF